MYETFVCKLVCKLKEDEF